MTTRRHVVATFGSTMLQRSPIHWCLGDVSWSFPLQVSKIFTKFDADGSGELSVEELESYLMFKVGANFFLSGNIHLISPRVSHSVPIDIPMAVYIYINKLCLMVQWHSTFHFFHLFWSQVDLLYFCYILREVACHINGDVWGRCPEILGHHSVSLPGQQWKWLNGVVTTGRGVVEISEAPRSLGLWRLLTLTIPAHWTSRSLCNFYWSTEAWQICFHLFQDIQNFTKTHMEKSE